MLFGNQEKVMHFAVLFNPEAVGYGFHFLPTKVLEELAEKQSAVKTSNSWQEVKSRLGTEWFDELVAETGEIPNDNESFDSDYIRYDKHWPMHVMSDEFDFLPDVLKEYVRIGNTRNGPYKYISLDDGPIIIEHLTEMGYDCLPTDEMMRAAYGYEF